MPKIVQQCNEFKVIQYNACLWLLLPSGVEFPLAMEHDEDGGRYAYYDTPDGGTERVYITE